ncbi:MAG TPA: BON domain-containing protein [Dongiaceae bacterium]|nr:BON domain-containing protein [Dongiaceae bacterium]
MHLRRTLLLIPALSAMFFVACGKLPFKPDDAAITTNIKAKMFSDGALKSSSVDVSSRGGEVTLTGQVPDDSARLAAYKIASEEKGVTKVNDQMTVAPPAMSMAMTGAPTGAMTAAPTPAPAPAPAPAGSMPKPLKKAPRPSATRNPLNSSDAGGPANSASSEPLPPPAAAPAPVAAAPAPPPPPQPKTVTVPAGGIITVRTIDGIDSSVNRTGQVFKASLDAPIVVDDHVVVPKGADAYIKLVNASSAGKFAGRSELSVQLQSVVFQGKTYTVASSDVKESGSSRGKRSAAVIGGGAALGALIGGLAGGGKGAGIGAAVGGGAGTGVQVFTKGQQVKIPSETRLDFTLEQPFDITYFPNRKAQASPDANPGVSPNASSDRPPSN